MGKEFREVFADLKKILGKHKKRLQVKADRPKEYTLHTKKPSPFPQHKGQPMFFGSVRMGKAYVSFHLLPLYMNPTLTKTISPALKKRMQGKACFNFKEQPDAALVAELEQLTYAGIELWSKQNWA